MFNPTLMNRIFHKYDVLTRNMRSSILQKQLNNIDFTIISNNCWGGIAYEAYGLKKRSPTVGCYLFAEDYLALIKNLKYYMALPIKMLTANESRHYDLIVKNGNENCPVGKLDDIDIVFVHYPTKALAYEKWMKRVERINWDNLIFKFSYMNACHMEQLNAFDKLVLPGKKFMFVNCPDHGYQSGIYYPGFENDEQIYNDTYFWNRYFNVTEFFNGKGISIKH